MTWEGWIRAHAEVARVSGDEHLVRCLWGVHPDRNPSMTINARTGLVWCRACGNGGTIVSLASKIGVDARPEPIPWGDILADWPDPTSEQADDDDAWSPKPEAWLNQFAHPEGHDWWRTRLLSDETIDAYRLGWDPFGTHTAATIPIRDRHGVLHGVTRRRIDAQVYPRYLYPADSSAHLKRLLWGSERIATGPEGLILCEGQIDAMAASETGVASAALLSNSLLDAHVRIVRDLDPRVIYAGLDNDERGQGHSAATSPTGRSTGVWRIRQMLAEFDLRVITWAPGKDPGDLSADQRQECLAAAETWEDWAARVQDLERSG